MLQPRTEPFAVALALPSRVFVSDRFHECVQLHDKEFRHLGSIRPAERDLLPTGMVFLPDGELTVAHYKNATVRGFHVGEASVGSRGRKAMSEINRAQAQSLRFGSLDAGPR